MKILVLVLAVGEARSMRKGLAVTRVLKTSDGLSVEVWLGCSRLGLRRAVIGNPSLTFVDGEGKCADVKKESKNPQRATCRF